ncbi:hypothetical protein FACS189461_4820 [Spirochaetia bacterium]|nr:hypothetical protein FACS189461_4820 [Spirochaetia bacterium]
MKTTNEKLAEKIRAFKNTDFSDVPPLTAEQLAQLKPSHYRPQNRVNMTNFKPIKKAVYVRLDADIIEWLKSDGDGYQTRMNSILRQAMAENV